MNELVILKRKEEERNLIRSTVATRGSRANLSRRPPIRRSTPGPGPLRMRRKKDSPHSRQEGRTRNHSSYLASVHRKRCWRRGMSWVCGKDERREENELQGHR